MGLCIVIIRDPIFYNLTNSLNATLSKTNITLKNCKLVDGGYAKIGKLVVVNMRIELTTDINATTVLLTGLPTYDGLNSVATANSEHKHIGVTNTGELTAFNNVGLASGSIIMITTTYICN